MTRASSELPDNPLAVAGWLDTLEAAGRLPPVLLACRRTPQPPNHPSEGDVYRHTRLAVGALATAAEWAGVEPTLDQAAAVLCHDLGKPACWDPSTGHFYGHDVVGAAMVPAFLDLVDPRSRVDRERVAWFVREHLFWLHTDLDLVRDAPVARRYLRPDGWGDDLRVVNLTDGLASWGPDGSPNVAYLERCQAKIEQVRKRLVAQASRPRPVLTGYDVMETLAIPEGREVGEWLRRVAATGITDPEEARRWLRREAS